MITEIELAKKLSEIQDPESAIDVIHSGVIGGINIYNENVNILLIKNSQKTEADIDLIKNEINNLLKNIKGIKNFKMDIQESEVKKNEVKQRKFCNGYFNDRDCFS